MLKTRVIPTLLLKGTGLVKTTKFKKPVYIGDPINAIRIFNTKEVDELILLDITASAERRDPPLDVIRSVADECFMPLSYGGGIKTIEDIRTILKTGVEKIIINHTAIENPGLIRAAANEFGSQAVIVAIDVKNSFIGGAKVVSSSGAKVVERDPVQWAMRMQEEGAGEIYLNSVDRDGTMMGYDIRLIASVADAIGIPVIAAGGARSIDDFKLAHDMGHAAAVSAGAMFVFQGPHRAVLITYPSRNELEAAL